ncbi:unnamed protein product, partial [Pylaiella littoralis]
AVAPARATKYTSVRTTAVRVDSARALPRKGMANLCGDEAVEAVGAPRAFVPSPPLTWVDTAAGPSATPAVRSAESRKKSKKAKRSAARARKRERKQDAAVGQGRKSVDPTRQQLHQHQHQQQQPQRSTRESTTAAAGVIQVAWRRVVKRVRGLRANALRVEERRRRERAVRVIAKAWHIFFTST